MPNDFDFSILDVFGALTGCGCITLVIIVAVLIAVF